MRVDQIIDRLLETGDPSIQYRVNKEMLGMSPDTSEMLELQTQIARKKQVVRVMSWPKEPQGGTGWIGTGLHGVTGFDVGAQILLERGLETTHPYLSQAREALIRRGDDYPDVPPTYSVLLAIDRAGRGGLCTMRALLLALLGAEEEPIVGQECESALFHFQGLRQIENLDQVAVPYTGAKKDYAGYRVYKQQVAFPGGWHLPLLAATTAWRSEETIALLADAFNNAVGLFPIPPVILKTGSHYVGPGNVDWGCLDWNDIRQVSGLDLLRWLMHIEWLGRVHVVTKVPHLCRQVEQLAELLEDERWVSAYKPHFAFKYLFGLEEDWRSKRRRENDVYFRFLIALYYCGFLPGLENRAKGCGNTA